MLQSLAALLLTSSLNVAWPQTVQNGGCTPAQRNEVLRSWQSLVQRTFPREVQSLTDATRPGGPLQGWRLSHGHVVIAGGGAVPLDNANNKAPMPQILMYAPSPSSSPADWIDFDGPDGPYRLIGWAYFAPFDNSSGPPELRCIREDEWVVHEAGWHLLNGGMLLTPDATAEPPRPPVRAGILMWHPRVWDIHFWMSDNGPTVAFDNPRAPDGGLCLPEASFYVLRNGRKAPVRREGPCRP